MRIVFGKLMMAVVVSVGALSLGACAQNYGRAPGYGGVAVAYDSYWGDPYGWRSVPLGYVGTGFGWYGQSYYPGTGAYVYDRRGVRRTWNARQRSYWTPRMVTQRPVIGNRVAGAIGRQGPQAQVRRQAPQAQVRRQAPQAQVRQQQRREDARAVDGRRDGRRAGVRQNREREDRRRPPGG